MITRDQIIAECRSWLKTPYHDQASLKGVGCDCLGLLRGVYTSLVEPIKEPTPTYSRRWGEIDVRDFIVEAADRYLIRKGMSVWLPGDVLIFRMKPSAAAKHCAFYSGNDRMIHAYSGHVVTETSIGPHWAKRVAAVYELPGIVE